MKIAIGNDHAGPDYKFAILNLLKERGIEVTNHGTDTLDSVDRYLLDQRNYFAYKTTQQCKYYLHSS